MPKDYSDLTTEQLKDLYQKRWDEFTANKPAQRPGPLDPGKALIDYPKPKSMKKGGKVKKTAVYKLHKGEKVIPAKKVTPARRNKMRRAMIGDK